jgi:ABC-2 type transport system ATP-binding protein/ribosome-dependent ATPase
MSAHTARGPLLLEAAHLTKAFGAFVAVDDVSFSVAPGEVVGLLGANGAGKTTAIRIALGLVAPTSGTALLLGRYPDRAVRQRIGYVPQGLGLYADMSVLENLQFVAAAYGGAKPELPESLAAVGDELVGEISLGSQRELAFACALLHRPELVILDEPTSGVGALTRNALWETIHERADSGVGVLVTTHYMQEAQQCDRLLLMAGGRLVAQGSEAEIVGDTTAVQVATAEWARTFDALSRAGLPVTLAGTDVRVADVPAAQVEQALAAAEIPAEVRAVPATIEERMTVLAGQLGAPAS